jgi:predicted alpha/beta-fold hydrolase
MPRQLNQQTSKKFPEFKSAIPWLGADLQTFRNFLIPKPTTLHLNNSQRIFFQMDDGSGDKLNGIICRPELPNSKFPLLILIHGLTGSEQSSYMVGACNYFTQCGYSVLRLNLRGSAATRGDCRRHYHAGSGEDLDTVLKQLVQLNKAPNGFILMGFSLGGNMLLKFISEYGASHPIRSSVSISAPIDLVRTSERLLQPRNKFYHHWLLRQMKRDALALKDISLKEKKIILNIRNVFQFDDRFVAPLNGFRGAVDYYKKCSSISFLDGILTPTLIISALDDPWVPSVMYLEKDWGRLLPIKIILPRHGGHLGFHDKIGCWYNRIAEIFFSKPSL